MAKKPYGQRRAEADEAATKEIRQEEEQDSSRADDPLIQRVREMANTGEQLFPVIPHTVYRGIDIESQGEDFRPDHSIGTKTYWTPDKRAAAANEVAIRLASGENLNKILGSGRDHSLLPNKAEFFRWMFGLGDEYVAQSYRLARQMKAEGYADELVDIADKAQECDEMARVNGYRLAIEARQFIMQKVLPKLYGNQQGAGAGLTINISTNLGGEESEPLDGTYKIVAPNQEDQE